MELISVPLYKARKIDSDEYIIGFLVKHQCKNCVNTYFIYLENSVDEVYEIDISTLSIHFPTMVDSKGTKLFASLNKNGIGGDKVSHEEEFQTFVLEFDFVSGVSMYEYLYNDDGSFYCKNFVKKFNCNSIFETYTFDGIK